MGGVQRGLSLTVMPPLPQCECCVYVYITSMCKAVSVLHRS